ncbi:hypothetical protein BK133_28895 [Paenibacillus sp. FSL H8-0548]|uniref:hypothetical protein n=1 Tax=Paenibacillus sp. FSL H8-0548 TaxID=1920422 RepID=UPI00096E999D|nr:hypothetical protein [Paenibacillus sp. FSL H8-0548]OMF21095.1 hypothetical protein BK133_28895 [Paenibacillus sp. FSL H8-0548]
MDYIRDYTMYAAIFGMFSFSWFGWAQERPRANWRIYIGIASGIALLVCLLGVYLSINNWNEPSALSDNTSFTVYLITVFIEFFVAGAGAFIIIRKKVKEYVAPWIAFIVGIHFISLVSVFDDSSLYVLAALLVAVSIFAVIAAPKLQVASSAITGIGSGTVLLCFAILGLVRYFSV